MEPEREIARVNGLGSGSILGFSLIITDQKIFGIDSRKTSVRLWLSMMLGLGLGMILVILVVFSGLEPLLFRISPILSFVGMFSIVISLPILMTWLVPRFLSRRIGQAAQSTIQALRRDIIRIEVRKPGRVTEKGYFTVRLMNGSSFSFWTVGRDMFDHVSSLLTSFAPGQISDSSISTGPDHDSDRPSNRILFGIIASLTILTSISVITLQPYLGVMELVGLFVGIVILHIMGYIGYLSIRRIRRHRRRML